MLNFNLWLENQNPFPNSTIKQIVYHGTNKKFDNFQFQKSKRYVLFSDFDVETHGFFFSESPHEALEFGPNVVQCYVNLTNPLLDPRRDKHLGIDRLDHKKEIDLQKILSPLIEKDGKYGFFIDLGTQRFYLNSRKNEKPIDWIYNAVNTDGLYWDVLDNQNVVKKMKSLGYDGTFVSEPNSYLGRSIFICDSSQIQIVSWFNSKQDNWKDKDDYFIRKVDGYGKLFSPLKESVDHKNKAYSWLTEKGEFIPIPPTETHAGWAAKQKLSWRTLMENGWQRIIYIGTEIYANNHLNIRPNLQQITALKDLVIESGYFEKIYFDNDAQDYFIWQKDD